MRQVRKQPVFLDLRKIHFPIGAVLSILHRITGVILVLAIPVFLYVFQLMNSGKEGFSSATELLQSIPGKVLSSLVLWLLIQHTLSGIRHLVMDLDFGYPRQSARKSARVAFGVSLLLIMASGWMIWQ